MQAVFTSMRSPRVDSKLLKEDSEVLRSASGSSPRGKKDLFKAFLPTSPPFGVGFSSDSRPKSL